MGCGRTAETKGIVAGDVAEKGRPGFKILRGRPIFRPGLSCERLLRGKVLLHVERMAEAAHCFLGDG
jgi:hypothetical protein